MIVKKHYIKDKYRGKTHPVLDSTWEITSWWLFGVIPLFISKTRIKGRD